MGIDLTTLLPPALLGLGGAAVFCLGAFWPGRPKNLLWLFSLAPALAALLMEIVNPAGGRLSDMLDGGALGSYFTMILTAIVVITLLLLKNYAAIRGFAGDELYGLVLVAGLGMILTATAVNWLVFFLGFELLSVCLYVLAAINRDETGSLEAGLKYLVMGVIAGGFLVFGIAILYAGTGNMNIQSGLAAITGDHESMALLAFAFILTGVFFKLSIVPFHLWTPDVYQGTPAPVVAFLSTGAKVALFAFLVRVVLALPDHVGSMITPVFWLLAAATMLIGNLSALRQSNLKRRLAYSSIAQMGYLLMALVVIRPDGLAAMMFYLAAYALMDLGAFGILGSFGRESRDLMPLSDYRGFGFTYPWRSAVMTFCLLSLAGFPPTAGFIGKWLILKSVLTRGDMVLAVIGLLAVIISLYYYVEVIVYLYMQPAQDQPRTVSPGFTDRTAWALIGALILVLGVAPSSFIISINRIASSVMTGLF